MTYLRGFFKRHRRHLLALAGFSLLTMLMTWPLVLHWSTHITGTEPGDNFELLWLFRWVATALQQGTDPWFAPHIYAPYGYPIVYGEVTPIHSFLLAPLTLGLGEIVTYNLITVLSTVMTGWGVFALTDRWLAGLAEPDDSRLRFLAAFFAATAFTFATYRLAKMQQGHLNLFVTQWLVMGLYFWDRWLVHTRLRDAALVGLAFGLAALSTWYLGVMLGIGLLVYALAYGEPLGRMRERRVIAGLMLAALIAAIMIVPFLLPYADIESVPEIPIEEVSFWSVSPTDYVLPNPLHPLWGRYTAPLAWPFPFTLPPEFAVSIGFVTAFFAFVGARRAKGPRWRALKWVVLVAFVLSLGPYLHISRLPLPIPLPALILRELPVFSSLRTWIRFAFVVQLGLSILGGAGIYLTLRSPRAARFRHGLAAALIGLVLFEAWPGSLGIVPVEPRPVDLWLAAQADDAPIMEYPLSVAESGPSLFYTLFHGKPITYAYGTFFEQIYLTRNPELATFPADAALDALQAWGVRQILITLSAMDDEPFTLDEVNSQPRLAYVRTEGAIAIYNLASPAE
ncbi:MAG TPA: hypothetical protein VER79_11475 [Candidatus Limnocylindrales bacterium]|nr:hypothetical protein [Candidatus Limnocylindrales bacterium]